MSISTTYDLSSWRRKALLLEVMLWLIPVGTYFLLPSSLALDLEHAQWWWLLLSGSLITVLYYRFLLWRRKARSSYADSLLVDRVVGVEQVDGPFGRFLLWRVALLLLTIALLNPRIGLSDSEVKYNGIDLMICLDVSNSMLAQDLAPSRLANAKNAISKLLGELDGDRVGLIVFAGDAYVQLPITTDYSAAQMFLRTVDNTMVPTQGTAIGAAIDKALGSFSEAGEGGRAIVVLTDGENHEDDAIEAAGRATDQGVTVHTIGMGSPAGGEIPNYINGMMRGAKKDKTGQVVISKIDEELLTDIARAGEGIYIRASSGDVGLDLMLEEIEKMEQSDFGSQQFTDHEPRFQWFLLPAILLLLLDGLIPRRTTQRPNL